MEQYTTYKATFKVDGNQWLFQYRKNDGVIYNFINISGNRVIQLLAKGQFPSTIAMMEEWAKYKELVTIELVLTDYSFEAFYNKYGLKRKRDLAEKAYEKLDLATKIKCFNTLPKYEADLAKTGQAKAHMVTWINQKRYNDEY
jgi:hypothetical protein